MVKSRRMKVKVGLWDQLSRVVVFLLFLAGLVGVFFWYLPLIKQNKQFRQQILALDAEIEKYELYTRQMREAMDALQTDSMALERAVREQLGWGRTNEVIFRFVSPAVAPSPQSSTANR